MKAEEIEKLLKKDLVATLSLVLYLILLGVTMAIAPMYFEMLLGGFLVFVIGAIITISLTDNRDAKFPHQTSSGQSASQTMSRRVASLGVVAVLVSMFLAFLIGELIYSFEFASFYYEISELFWFVVFVALILQLVHRSKELIPFAIENDKEKTLTDLKSALLVSLAITPPVVLLIMRENYFYQITTDPSNLAISLPRNFVLMFFLVALPEEYAFRYVLQGSLRTLFQKKSPSVSITIASLFFGIIHIPLFIDEGIAIALTVPFVYQGIIGALYGIFWHRTDSLLGAVLIHAWFDMLIFAV